MTAITDRQREILRHALGLTYDSKITRDHFNAEPGTQDCEDCERLVELGLMVNLIPISWVPGSVFRATDRGRQIALDSEWIDCWSCGGDGYSDHDCGEDVCCCLHPEDNVPCEICAGSGGWWSHLEEPSDA